MNDVKPSNAQTMVKIALLPNILRAAQLLHECGIIKVDAAACVRLYVKKNPDINEVLSRYNPSFAEAVKQNPF